MRKPAIATLMLAGCLALTGCTGKAPETAPPAETQTVPLNIEVLGGMEHSLLPGAVLEGAPAICNAGSLDVYCFLKVEMPVFPAEAIALEADEPASDSVPLIRCSISDAWTLVEQGEADGVTTSVYIYGGPQKLGPGETTPALFTDWRVPNFRVRSGMCGKTPYEDLMARADKLQINGYAIQADHIGSNLSPETLWAMIN